MKHILRFIAGLIFAALAGSALAQPIGQFVKVVPSGGSLKVDYFGSLDPTCRRMGPTTVNLVKPPRYGQVLTEVGPEFPNFSTLNTRSRCNTRKMPSTRVIYDSAPGYAGMDDFVVEIISPTGSLMRRRYVISVR